MNQIFKYKERIAEISSQASNEATVEQMLQRVSYIMSYLIHSVTNWLELVTFLSSVCR